MSYAFLIYVTISLMVGWFGANRKLGFWAYFFGSLALTPFIGLLLVLVSDPRSTEGKKP